MRKNRIRILSMVVFSLCLPFSLFAQIDKDMKEFDDFVKQQQKAEAGGTSSKAGACKTGQL